MAADIALNALIRKRAELAGELERHESTVRQLRIDLDSLDATIRLFNPEVDVTRIEPKRLRAQAADKGGFGYVIFAVLRSAGRPCTAREIALHAMAQRGMNTANQRAVKSMTVRACASLRHYRKRGLLRSIYKAGEYLQWEIVAEDDATEQIG